jgi:hypothetical protein
MLGHSNIKTTQHYAKVLDSKTGHDMAMLQEKLQAIKVSQAEVRINKEIEGEEPSTAKIINLYSY